MKRYSILAFIALSLGATQVAAQMIPAPGQMIPRNDPNGVYCREYTQPVLVGGMRRTSYGTACQQPDGSWKIVSSDQAQQPEQVQYLSPPQFVGAPQYVVPPVAYYAPPPVYYAQPYPYYAAPGVVIGFGGYYGHGGYYHGGYYRH